MLTKTQIKQAEQHTDFVIDEVSTFLDSLKSVIKGEQLIDLTGAFNQLHQSIQETLDDNNEIVEELKNSPCLCPSCQDDEDKEDEEDNEVVAEMKELLELLKQVLS